MKMINRSRLNRVTDSVRAQRGREQQYVVAEWRKDGWFILAAPANLERANFLIRSHFGTMDWSGFRTLKECLDQKMNEQPDGFYKIVMR